MNNFFLQGKLIYSEPPKRTGGSMLILLEIGKDIEKKDKTIQKVNKVIVRVPGRLTSIFKNIKEGDYLEVTGTLIGRVYYSIGSSHPVGTLNLVASGIQVCKISHKINENSIKNMLFSQFIMSGLVKAVQAPKDEKKPYILFLQIERPIARNKDSTEQPTAVVPVVVPGYKAHLLSGLEPQDFIIVSGKISSTMRKMPIPDVPGQFEERLEASTTMNHLQKCAVIPMKIFESRQEKFQRYQQEKEDQND